MMYCDTTRPLSNFESRLEAAIVEALGEVLEQS
jgi:hypothetical protein